LYFFLLSLQLFLILKFIGSPILTESIIESIENVKERIQRKDGERKNTKTNETKRKREILQQRKNIQKPNETKKEKGSKKFIVQTQSEKRQVYQ
jgi:hypothetical protein